MNVDANRQVSGDGATRPTQVPDIQMHAVMLHVSPLTLRQLRDMSFTESPMLSASPTHGPVVMPPQIQRREK